MRTIPLWQQGRANLLRRQASHDGLWRGLSRRMQESGHVNWRAALAARCGANRLAPTARDAIGLFRSSGAILCGWCILNSLFGGFFFMPSDLRSEPAPCLSTTERSPDSENDKETDCDSPGAHFLGDRLAPDVHLRLLRELRHTLQTIRSEQEQCNVRQSNRHARTHAATETVTRAQTGTHRQAYRQPHTHTQIDHRHTHRDTQTHRGHSFSTSIVLTGMSVFRPNVHGAPSAIPAATPNQHHRSKHDDHLPPSQ